MERAFSCSPHNYKLSKSFKILIQAQISVPGRNLIQLFHPLHLNDYGFSLFLYF
jgi:hypothetical protein